MFVSVFLAYSQLLISPAAALYSLSEDYQAGTDSFFNKFNFFTKENPTGGYTNYIDRSLAKSTGLIKSVDGKKTYIGVDSQTVLDPNSAARGRNAIRLQSTKTYNGGLFVLDLDNMPAGACGAWPSWWFYSEEDSDGAQDTGEIDVIEGVHTQTRNEMTVHAYTLNQQCTIDRNDGSSTFGTSGKRTDCYDKHNGGAGCEVLDSRSNSFGSGFNKEGGGVYALEWTSNALKIWFFNHQNAKLPNGPLEAHPNPSGWGKPAAVFAGNCPFNSYFQNLNMRFNTAFCGDAADDFGSDPGQQCSKIRQSCKEYVARNPSAFSSTFWMINSLKVYQQS